MPCIVDDRDQLFYQKAENKRKFGLDADNEAVNRAVACEVFKVLERIYGPDYNGWKILPAKFAITWWEEHKRLDAARQEDETRRRIQEEYILVKKIKDTEKQLQQLRRKLK